MITLGVDISPSTIWHRGEFHIYACVLANGSPLASLHLKLSSAKNLQEAVQVVTETYEFYACDCIVSADDVWQQPLKEGFRRLPTLWVHYKILEIFMRSQHNLQFWKDQVITHNLYMKDTPDTVRALAYYPFHQQTQVIKL